MRVGGGLKVSEVDTAKPEQHPEPRISWRTDDHEDIDRASDDKLREASGVLAGTLIGLCLWLLIGIVACVLLAMSGY